MENLTERERQVIAMGLWANGASLERIAEILGITTGEAQDVLNATADDMSAGKLGAMKSSRALSADSSE